MDANAYHEPSHRKESLESSCVGSAVTSWPSLRDLSLAPDAIAKRKQGIDGSDANIILCGDRDAVLRLWREKRGEAEPQHRIGEAVFEERHGIDMHALAELFARRSQHRHLWEAR